MPVLAQGNSRLGPFPGARRAPVREAGEAPWGAIDERDETMATVINQTDVKPYQMFINGRWVDAKSGQTDDIVDPGTEQVIARVPRAAVGDAEDAVRAAREAFDHGPWPRMKAETAALISSASRRIVCTCSRGSQPSILSSMGCQSTSR